MSTHADIQADISNSSPEASEYKFKEAISTALEAPEIHNGQLHYVRRGQEVSDDTFSTDSIEGYEAEQMRARALLTYEEEKKLLRRIDWHIMPLCSIAFLLKNIDFTNVSNVRIMNTGTHQNILTQLGMTADEFNFVSTIYYVRTLTFVREYVRYRVLIYCDRFHILSPRLRLICSSNKCCHPDGNPES
jgi:hypothetical protein